ncbi:hypothetical protein RUND412_003590 [Rhizina undulata]
MEFFMNNYGPATPHNSSQSQVNPNAQSAITGAGAPNASKVLPAITPQVKEYYQTLSYERMQAFRKLHTYYNNLKTLLPEFKRRLPQIEEDIESFRTQMGLAEMADIRQLFEIRFVRAIAARKLLVKTINGRKQELRKKDKEYMEQRGKLMEALEYYYTKCCEKDNDYVQNKFKKLFGDDWERELEISDDEDEEWKGPVAYQEVMAKYSWEADDETVEADVDEETVETEADNQTDEEMENDWAEEILEMNYGIQNDVDSEMEADM